MHYGIYKNKQFGFTLLELLLVLSMVGIIAMFSMSLGLGFIWRTDLSSGEALVVSSLRRAQILSQSQVNDKDWGVHIKNNKLIIFEGNNFINRNISIDEEYELGSVLISEPVDVVFHKYTGKPYENLYEITLNANNEAVDLSINSEGIINY